MQKDGVTLLIVDDDPGVRHTLGDIFRFVGYRVQTATSGASALSAGDVERADCILSDIRMHDMNGIEFCRTVKERRPSVPVILMSAYNSDDVKRDGLAAGAEAAMTKPLDIEELLNTISGICAVASR